ncbi:hypothetical protein E2C01_094404 [Portunus trituberculatus]|uniref:Uncharacterized protein n=1 Tax=Portunus trituberculatus TaxID=210409 RepID=A0A5B7JM18_PORTR|nr:hypothetical protein [Portunus trituberculatus]
MGGGAGVESGGMGHGEGRSRGTKTTQWARPVAAAPTPTPADSFLTASAGEQRGRPRACPRKD